MDPGDVTIRAKNHSSSYVSAKNVQLKMFKNKKLKSGPIYLVLEFDPLDLKCPDFGSYCPSISHLSLFSFLRIFFDMTLGFFNNPIYYTWPM